MNRDLASRIANDTADFCDLIWRKANEGWANAASGTAPLGKPEPQSPFRLGPDGRVSLSQEQPRDDQ